MGRRKFEDMKLEDIKIVLLRQTHVGVYTFWKEVGQNEILTLLLICPLFEVTGRSKLGSLMKTQK